MPRLTLLYTVSAHCQATIGPQPNTPHCTRTCTARTTPFHLYNSNDNAILKTDCHSHDDGAWGPKPRRMFCCQMRSIDGLWRLHARLLLTCIRTGTYSIVAATPPAQVIGRWWTISRSWTRYAALWRLELPTMRQYEVFMYRQYQMGLDVS